MPARPPSGWIGNISYKGVKISLTNHFKNFEKKPEKLKENNICSRWTKAVIKFMTDEARGAYLISIFALSIFFF